nr:PREDICTED: uncharacterized protein LOC103313593 [Tribolium castaneum]|eukprot:XP_008195474.2 PREDICTED: uncharacterized protein LOC103313593 [Tribolium castaneum]
MSHTSNEIEVKSWLAKILKNADNFSVKIEGNSEKGDGYLGDILFVQVTENTAKKHNLVLKCAKKSKLLREKSPVQEAYLNEILFYETVYPDFVRFQRERGVENGFDNVVKCYGTLISGDMEIIAMDNLKKKGYVLWDRKIPLTRKHIDLVASAYGKLHAISIAMRDQEPQRFESLAKKPFDFFVKFMKMSDMITTMERNFDEITDLMAGELEDGVLRKWKDSKRRIRPFWENLREIVTGMKVLTHGDCWNNNFMHYHINGEPADFVMIDWQLIYLTSPIYDLSYFLFACISEEDINDLDKILQLYHSSLRDHLKKLGSNPDLYPFEDLVNDWKKYSFYGVIITNIIHKFVQSDKDEVPDLVDSVESGEDMADVFNLPIKNTEDYKKRRLYITKYVVEQGLI